MENIPHDNLITDEQILILLDNKSVGMSFPDALSRIGTNSFSSEEVKILKSVWNLDGNLMRESHNISPNRALLSGIIDKVLMAQDISVTKNSNMGYTEHSAENRFINSNTNINTFMQMNWKIVAPIAVLVIVVAAAMSMGGNKKDASLAVSQPGPVVAPTTSASDNSVVAMKHSPSDTNAMMAMNNTTSVKPASGNLDDLVASLSLEANGDAALLNDRSTDIALVTADSQSVNDFNTTYNETTF